MRRQTISIITPCYNEAGNVAACATEVSRVMREQLPGFDYEQIFCDNASTDRTVVELRELAAGDPRIRVVVNSRNVGPFRNIANGLRHAHGDLIVPMVPADLQDPPSVLPDMVAKLGSDLDVVYGVRNNRHENLILRFFRGVYYRVLKASGGSMAPAHAGEFLVARRDVIDAVLQVAGGYPYVRGLIAQTHPRFDTVKYEWARRNMGRSKNSFPDLVDQALNGIVSTARTPMRWALLLGTLLAVTGVVIGVWNFFLFVFAGSHAALGIPTLIVATFVFGGVNLFFVGLIGEYVLSIHQSVRPEPPMFERELINFPEGR